MLRLRRNPIRCLGFSLLGIAILTTLTGCNLLGLAAYKLSGATKNPARYKLAQEPTLVLVERASNPAEATTDAARIAQVVSDLLRTNKAVPVVDSMLAMEARSHRGPEGRRLRPSEIALACHATQVIYIDLTKYNSTPAIAGEVVEGQIDLTVRVIDAKTGTVRWPQDGDLGFPMSEAIPFTPTTGGVSEASLRQSMDDKLALKLARLFYEWSEE